MEIGPIPNIPAMPAKVSSATPADLPSTRAVSFYPQQEDASYTPSDQDQQDQQEANQQETAQQGLDEQDFMQLQNFSLEIIETKKIVSSGSPDDPPIESTISLFA